ncbi:PUA domain-containing protein, partial [uncultured Collinsella sp.]
VGTRFVPPAARLEIAPRKLWIALGDSAHGFVTVDAGAAGALVERGSSLLPVGITGVEGDFAAGDVLDVRDADGLVIARGIAEAGHDELELAAGRHQEDIAGNHLLAALANKPAIHRDNLIVFA